VSESLKKAGADEIISSDGLGLRLLARSALVHGMTRVYQELLTVGRDANEMFLLPAPEGLVEKNFIELTGMFVGHREDKKSCLLIGIQRGDEMHLKPIAGESGPLLPDDQLILLSRVLHDPSQPLPIVPSATHPTQSN
jgi:voltage-gated potassium channel